MKDLDGCCHDPYFIARTGALIQEGLTLIFVEINTKHRTGGLLEMEEKGWELGLLAYGKMIYLYTLFILIKREVILI